MGNESGAQGSEKKEKKKEKEKSERDVSGPRRRVQVWMEQSRAKGLRSESPPLAEFGGAR